MSMSYICKNVYIYSEILKPLLFQFHIKLITLILLNLKKKSLFGIKGRLLIQLRVMRGWPGTAKLVQIISIVIKGILDIYTLLYVHKCLHMHLSLGM